MAGKINVFGLGEKGVNLVKSPLHLDDGELTSAQNAEFFRNQGRGGIRKRGGLARFNANALGTIRRFMNVPLPASPTVTIFSGVNGTNTETWLTTTDGTTWAEAIAPARQYRQSRRTSVNLQPLPRIASIDGRLYYPADDYVQYPTASHQAPPILAYDGLNAGEVCQIPPNPSVAADANAKGIELMTTLNGKVYLATQDGASSVGAGIACARVFRLDASGQLTQIGPNFGDLTGETNPGSASMYISALGWGAGRLWLGLMNDSGSIVATKLYSILPDVDTAWTLENTFINDEVKVVSIAEYRGLLYVSMVAGALVQARVYVRGNNLSGWSSSDTQAVIASTYKGYGGLVPFDDALYVPYNGDGANIIRKFNGTAWSTDLNVAGLVGAGAAASDGMVIRNVLYFVVGAIGGGTSAKNGTIIRKTSGGAWAVVGDFSTVIGSAAGSLGYTIL